MATLTKHKPPRRPAHNDIFVKRTTPLQAYLRRAESLLESRHTVIIIHGLGAAILTAVRLANILQKKYPTMELNIQTGTQHVIDQREDESEINRRSAVHIRLSMNIYE